MNSRVSLVNLIDIVAQNHSICFHTNCEYRLSKQKGRTTLIPKEVHLDFEEALGEGFSKVFPGATIMRDFFPLYASEREASGQIGDEACGTWYQQWLKGVVVQANERRVWCVSWPSISAQVGFQSTSVQCILSVYVAGTISTARVGFLCKAEWFSIR